LEYKIKSFFNEKNRKKFKIVDKDDNILSDASGQGYGDYRRAIKAAWYLFGGGKEKRERESLEAEEFFNTNIDIKNEIVSALVDIQIMAENGDLKNSLIEIKKMMKLYNIPKKYEPYILDKIGE
jgi:hypothetical protein